MQSSQLADDRPTLFVLGGVAYVGTMLLHEAIGHGVGCVLAGGHAVVTSVATQCSVQSVWMVLAGPLLNGVAGSALWRYLSGNPHRQPQQVFGFWLFMAFNLLLGSGYLLFCGVAGFGDWAVIADPWLPAMVWRPAAVSLGAALYYICLLGLARRLPASTTEPSRRRLLQLVWWPYLGAGVVGALAGLLNPIDLTRRLLLPLASSFGAGFGLTRLPYVLPAGSAPDAVLGRLERQPGWLIVWSLTMLLLAGLLGAGVSIGR